MKILWVLLLLPLLAFGQYGANKIIDPSFETTDQWEGYTTEPPDVVERSAVQKHSGSYSWIVTVNAVGEGVSSIAANDPTLVAGRDYRMGGWLYRTADLSFYIDEGYNRLTVPVYADAGTDVWAKWVVTGTAQSSGEVRVWGRATTSSGANVYADDFILMEVLDTLWTNSGMADETSDDTTKTLTEAFETRGAHSGGHFITEAGTYDESITIDSSFTKWEGTGGMVTVTAVDFADKTCTVDTRYLTITTPTNDGNVTYIDTTPADDTSDKFKGFKKSKGWPIW